MNGWKDISLIYTVYHNKRLEGDFLTLNNLIKENVLGKIKSYSSKVYRNKPNIGVKQWKEGNQFSGAGLLYDIGSHLIDQCLQLFGKPTNIVSELKIERENLSLIEFDTSERSLARRIGIGFNFRPNGSEETISLKNWLSPADSAGLLVGYNAGNEDSFSVEIRYSRVFKIEGTNDLFYGAGTGIISNEDKKDTLLRFFSGY